MKSHAAFLRGINISGKNKLPMAELKKGLEGLGFEQVKTYLNSGNVVFSCTIEEERAISDKIHLMIRDVFSLDIPVFVITRDELSDVLAHAPDWWDSGDREIYDNLIFLIPPLTYERFYKEIGEPKAEYERVYNYKRAVFWSFRLDSYRKTNWWHKTASLQIGEKITIRTANTVRKTACI